MMWKQYGDCFVSELFEGLGSQYPCYVCKWSCMFTIYTKDSNVVMSIISCTIGGCRKMFTIDKDNVKRQI